MNRLRSIAMMLLLAVVFIAQPRAGAKDAPATPESGKVQISIDTSEMPELKDWAESKLRPVLEEWYPKIVEQLPGDNFAAPTVVQIKFFADMKGVANASGTHVRCAGPWFKQNLEGEAKGAVVHELVHVVQQYRSRKNPSWLVEGVADYIRWFEYEPISNRPHVNPDRAKYTDSYRTTAAFLNFVLATHDKDIVRKLNEAMRQNKYSPELWAQLTGKSVDELWDEFTSSLRKNRSGN